ncbi:MULTISPECIES: hypothetical protein [unclassified Luteimonas]|jgi:hypothetical protein|uniref:hypothetical protein n=1 Tax=unclassified Luteimonas TaxID=2629088 RepID=UPI000B8D6600|nr:hypothetical protein [Luteimonas sp. RC10]ASR42920.1 hypothetical protein BEN78_05510 [Xanthomonas citri pv. mangiferaeindicae]MBB3342835.1 hypothetical protein [Luteimonas sp. RC10]
MTTISNDAIGNFIGRASMHNDQNTLRGTRTGGAGGGSSSWYEAMSRAWGQTLDAQATRITNLSDVIGQGGDQPSNVVALTAESLRMQFLSNNASTSQNSVGQALETLGRKQ